MLINFTIAWRNLWRSRTRTILLASIVFIVVVLSTTMTSQQYGSYESMIKNVIEITGNVQIQDTAYFDNKTLNNSLEVTPMLLKEISMVKGIEMATPHLEAFALASQEMLTKGVLVLGIDPVGEDQLTGLSGKVVRYTINQRVIEETAKSFDDTVLVSLMSNLNGTTFISSERIAAKFEDATDREQLNIVQSIIQQYGADEGRYLTEQDEGILVSERLSNYLSIQVGDTLALISQGYHGVSSAGLFPVRGIVKIPSPDLDRRLVYMSLTACQDFYSAYGRVTGIIIKQANNQDPKQLANDIQRVLPDALTALTWQEMNFEMMQLLESDKAGGVFMKGIFYMIIGFILFGTVMMMLSERRYEFGVVMAIGMKKGKLLTILFIETLLVSFLGVVLGFMVSIPVVQVFHNNPIPLQGELAGIMEDYGFEAVIYFSNSPDIFAAQALIVFLIAVGIFIFPVYHILKLNVMNALRK